MKPCLFLALTLFVVAPAWAANFNVTNNSTFAYIINSVSNPALTLERGTTYTFAVNAPGHPFWIKTIQGTGTANAYNVGVTNNGTQSGTLTFVVPAAAPNTLFYNCQFHADMTNVIHIIDNMAVEAVTWSRVKELYDD